VGLWGFQFEGSQTDTVEEQESLVINSKWITNCFLIPQWPKFVATIVGGIFHLFFSAEKHANNLENVDFGNL
jgi:hypothetical protein